METISVKVRVRSGCEDLALPAYETDHASGMDLRAAVDGPLVLQPGERTLVPTGIHIAVPVGYEGQVRPRSGLAARDGLTLVNAPGTIDADYRGEVKVVLINLGEKPVTINRGDRIAQLVICPVVRAVWDPVDELEDTARSSGGFGHTGR